MSRNYSHFFQKGYEDFEESDDIESSQESEQSSQRSQSETNRGSPKMARIKAENALLATARIHEGDEEKYLQCWMHKHAMQKDSTFPKPNKKISQKNMIGWNLLILHR